MSPCAYFPFDTAHRGDQVFVLPNSNYSPARLAQSPVGISISRDVCVDLGPPPCGVVLGAGAVDRAPVPEATVDEDRDARRGKGDVDCSARPLKRARMDAETQTSRVEQGP